MNDRATNVVLAGCRLDADIPPENGPDRLANSGGTGGACARGAEADSEDAQHMEVLPFHAWTGDCASVAGNSEIC